MQNYVGSVLELRLNEEGRETAHGHSVRIACPEKAIPAPGQYLLAHAPEEADAPLARVIFPAGRAQGSFVAAPPAPPTWQIGTLLHLRGPLGKGFRLPGKVRNLALASLSETSARLLPLLQFADNAALFTPSPLYNSDLPSSLEILPLNELSAALQWADFLAIDIPIERLSELPRWLGLGDGHYIPCPVQVLVFTPLPCGGLADCGVCAVPHGKSYALACKDGPVFELNKLL